MAKKRNEPKYMSEPHQGIHLFSLREGYHSGAEIAAWVAETIPHGRSLINPHDAGLMAQMILDCRHGDHLEIGTLFGGSAIVAAMIKKEYGAHGKIVCVDPLNPPTPDILDHASKAASTRETLEANLDFFGILDRVEIVQEKSTPWPFHPARRFATCYIDGDHWGGTPRMDIYNARMHTSYMIMVDDYCMGKPEVIEAAQELCGSKEWTPVQISGLSILFRKKM